MAAMVHITPSQDGPNLVVGEIELVWPGGHRIPAGQKVALCRCGHSNDKPFCDGTHVKVGFKSREGDETAHKEPNQAAPTN